MHIEIQNAYVNYLELTDWVLITDFCVDVYLYIFTPIYLHTFIYINIYIYVHMAIVWLAGLKMLNCKQKFTINQYYQIKINTLIKYINTKSVTASMQMHFASILINIKHFYFRINYVYTYDKKIEPWL